MKTISGVALALGLIVHQANGFALLGPYEDWMQRTNGFRYFTDIGGPMNLGEEYRWNVPVLTYAFDQSFLDFFGSNGVAAVEQALAILNSLPPASQLEPTHYPAESLQVNHLAQALGYTDVKSRTLQLLLEQLGLAEPTRHVFCLHSFGFNGGVLQPLVLNRNFDPVDFSPTNAVNNTEYAYGISVFTNGTQISALANWFPTDPLDVPQSAVADGALAPGSYYSGLTRDDVGGLRYLLRTNNVNAEVLLPGVYGIGPNAGNYVNQAPRLGVDKITFVRRNYDSLTGHFFTPYTNHFTDRYLSNNSVVEQQLERTSTRPDFLFAAGDPGHNVYGYPFVARTATSLVAQRYAGCERPGPHSAAGHLHVCQDWAHDSNLRLHAGGLPRTEQFALGFVRSVHQCANFLSTRRGC